ncbi:uncharacterized protein si:ch73-95l15.5 [Antennarius striatus]|uniref:uncharacterized protein si:ch73-95l15.5 n=1 Tax=Antennarius striatus TaxID=241820 RepID=UPI0035AFAC47
MMSSRGINDLCLICGGALQGNQRRWLFGSQHKKNVQASADSLRGRSPSQSLQSSPWGSTISLGSSTSISKYQLSPRASSKGTDLLSVLTHILGQSVPRGDGQGEFVCGKCVCALERVFKFDTVIARVRMLSSERLQKLLHERDKIRRWVRQNYRQRHPQDFQTTSSTSEEDGEGEKEGYREMLKENMALSEYECWSKRWDTCPYFIKTGKRCRKGKGCEGCDSLRVSDSDYESVCGIPRHLPLQSFSPLALSRDRSQSMPLNWQKTPSISYSSSSTVGSSLSLQESSHTVSMQSLDSLDNNDPFEPSDALSAKLVLMELKSINMKPVNSPSGSRIPVLSRNDGWSSGNRSASPSVNKVLDFADLEDRGDDVDEGVLAELNDEFTPLHRENGTSKFHHAVRHLRGQLDQAVSRIRTLEAELKHGSSKPPEASASEDWAPEEGDGSLLRSFGHCLHSRERVIQECLCIISRMCNKEAGTEIAAKLSETLDDMLSDNKAALESWRSEMTKKEDRMEKEMDALRKAGRDREGDIGTLNTVLQCNQDIINDLRVAVEERERLLKQVEKEREESRLKEEALHLIVQTREATILKLWEKLEPTNAQEVNGGGAQLDDSFKGRNDESEALCKEVIKLTTTLRECQDMMQKQQESHSQKVSSLTAELRDTRKEMREKEKEKKAADRERQNVKNDREREREERKLRNSLEKRDKLIEQILLEAENRDHLFRELQQKMQNIREPLTGFKHTL